LNLDGRVSGQYLKKNNCITDPNALVLELGPYYTEMTASLGKFALILASQSLMDTIKLVRRDDMIELSRYIRIQIGLPLPGDLAGLRGGIDASEQTGEQPSGSTRTTINGVDPMSGAVHHHRQPTVRASDTGKSRGCVFKTGAHGRKAEELENKRKAEAGKVSLPVAV